MQTNANTLTIASPAKDFASLEAITDVSYEYTIEINVNKQAVVDTKAVKLVVRSYETNPLNAVNASIFDGNKTSSILEQDPASIISKIRSQAITNTTLIKTIRSSYMTSVDYNLLDLITKNNNGVGYALITSEPIQGEINQLKTSDNKIDQTPLQTDRTISQASINLLKTYKLDPAQAVVKTYATNTAFDTSNGILGAHSSSPNFNNEANKIAGELLSDNNKKENTQPPRYKAYKISEQDEIPVFVPVSFDKSKIGTKNFYIVCSFYDTDGSIVQEFAKFVDNSTNINFFKLPRIPPSFEIYKQKDGQLAFTFTQLDPNSFGIKLYKTVYNQTNSFKYVTQNLVGKYQVPFGQTETFLVQNNDLGLLLFRAVSFEGTSNSSNFTSQIVKIESPTEESINNNMFITLDYEYTPDGLKLIVANIPNDISVVKVYKTNFSIDPRTETTLTSFFVGGMGINNAFSYTDNQIDSFKNYRYRLVVLDIYGNEYDSTAILEINYRPQTQGYAAVTVTDPIKTITTINGSKTAWDISFNISYAIVPGLEQNVRNLLTSQNLIQYYGKDILPSELQRLLVTKIELRDLDTDDRYFIGFTDGFFVQSQTNFGLITKPSRYAYELTTFVRNPVTLLQGNKQTAKSQPRPSTNNVTPNLGTAPEYTYVPFNVAHPQGLLTGTNPKNNGNEFVTNTGYNQLEFGEITNITYLKIDLLQPVPTVGFFRAFQFNKNNVQLNWAVDGEQGQISHFIIRRQNMATNKIDLIGKAHGINTDNNFKFIDPLRPTDKGIYRYILTIQYFDMTLSANYNSNEVVI